MGFKLIIEFHGLCLFVPDAANGVMHVLLPDGAGDVGPHAHAAAFHFDPVHHPAGDSEVAFEGVRWNLSNIVSDGIDLFLPTQVLDIAPYVRPAGIERHQLTPGKQTGIKSHMVLTGGEVMCHGDAPRFNIGPDKGVSAASMLRWIIDVPTTNTLDWTFEDLNATSTTAPTPLVPVDGVIRLFLMHAPSVGNPLHICRPGQANHAPMYYPLFKGTGPMPVCRGTKDVEQGSCGNVIGAAPASEAASPSDAAEAQAAAAAAAAWRASGAVNRAPNVFTCMIGKTAIDPAST